MREKNQYTNSSQQALLAVVETLAGQPLRAQTLTGLADSLGAPRDGVYRTLKNLHQGGWVEEQGGGWVLSPRLVHIAERLRLAIAGVHARYLEQAQADSRISYGGTG